MNRRVVIAAGARLRLWAVVLLWIGVAGGAYAATDAPAPADGGDAFDVWEFRVLGAQVLPAADVERAVYPHLGPAGGLPAAERARESLERLYRERGYATVFVDIPEQRVEDGIVRLRVTEGRLDRIRVTGARYFSQGQIRAAVPELERGRVPHMPTLQQQLADVNQRSADRAVTPVLRAGRTPGTVDAELKIEDSLPVQASLELNNRYTADTSELRAAATLGYDNLFGRQHSLSLQYQDSPQDRSEVDVFAATYLHRLSKPGRSLVAYYVQSNSDVATLGTLNVIGDGEIVGLRFVEPLPGPARGYASLAAGVDYKHFVEDVRLPGDVTLRTPISYLAWSVALQSGWRGETRSLDYTVGANFGIRGLGNDRAEFEDKRFLGAPNFFALRAGGTLAQRWRGFEAALRLAGQYSATPLVSNEQYGIGGVDTVRGYLESEVLGDMGFSGSLELRTPHLAPQLQDRVEVLQAFGFVDAGVVALNEPLPGQERRVDLSSIGLGVRTAVGGFRADVGYAWPRVPGPRTLRNDGRAEFLVRYGF